MAPSTDAPDSAHGLTYAGTYWLLHNPQWGFSGHPIFEQQRCGLYPCASKHWAGNYHPMHELVDVDVKLYVNVTLRVQHFRKYMVPWAREDGRDPKVSLQNGQGIVPRCEGQSDSYSVEP